MQERGKIGCCDLKSRVVRYASHVSGALILPPAGSLRTYTPHHSQSHAVTYMHSHLGACFTCRRAQPPNSPTCTGALRVGAEFLKRHHSVHIVYLPDPTWGNHLNICGLAGHQVRRYRYWDAATRGLDYQVCQGRVCHSVSVGRLCSWLVLAQ